MNRLAKLIRSGAVLSAAGISLLLFAPLALGQSSQCNAPAAAPVSYVPLPGHPFSTISSRDGCWLFVSVTSSNPKSANGVALLSRGKGQITLKKVFPVEPEPTGMVLTHDGKLLIVADGDYVVFMDVMSMTTGKGDPILGYISDGNLPAAFTSTSPPMTDSFLSAMKTLRRSPLSIWKKPGRRDSPTAPWWERFRWVTRRLRSPFHRTKSGFTQPVRARPSLWGGRSPANPRARILLPPSRSTPPAPSSWSTSNAPSLIRRNRSSPAYLRVAVQ